MTDHFYIKEEKSLKIMKIGFNNEAVTYHIERRINLQLFLLEKLLSLSLSQ